MMKKTESSIIIYTDGSSRGNPGRGGWGAILIFRDENGELKVESENSKVIEIGGREEHTTNNRMELTAAINALKEVKRFPDTASQRPITIHSDSSYVINGITKWINGWRRNGWKTKSGVVLNQDLWQILGELNDELEPSWQYVAGHAGTVGNERADDIATAFADSIDPNLYNGPLSKCPYSLSQDAKIVETEKTSKRRSAKGKAYSYVSMVDGKVETHRTWRECEERVRGASGAKFRKSLSPEDENQIITEFESGQ